MSSSISLLGICIDVSCAIEEARVSSIRSSDIVDVCCGKVLSATKLAYKIMFEPAEQKCSSLFVSLNNEIRECLFKMKYVLNKISSKRENYFCIFRHELYMVELKGVVAYLKELVAACETAGAEAIEESLHPLWKLHSLTSPLPYNIPDVSSRLFWTKYFKSAAEVDWLTYIHSFSLEFGPHHEYAYEIYKSKLSKRTSDGECLPVVTLPDFISFGMDDRMACTTLSVYEAFQFVCDTGSVVLMTGILMEAQSSLGGVIEGEQEPLWRPTVIESLLGLQVIQVSCGNQHAAVIGEDGSLYTWGRGGFGRLGHGDVDYHDIPRRVMSLKSVKLVHVTCGFAFSGAVSDQGIPYTWGAGDNGRLGLGDMMDRHTPTIVDALMDERALSIHAGSVHTAFLTIRGRVFTCGKGDYCGHGDSSADVLSPTLLDSFDGCAIKEISVGPGGYHTIALTNKNEIYTWGHNRVGQLGYENSPVVPRNADGAYYLPRPVLLKNIFQAETSMIAHVVAGWGHTGIITEEGTVYMCGRNLQGQLGLGAPRLFPSNERGHPFQPTLKPITSLEQKKICRLACGGEHSMFLSNEGEIYAVGAGSKGQLGTGLNADFSTPVFLSDFYKTGQLVSQVACGNNYSLILAGKFIPMSLQKLCAEVIEINPGICT